MPTLSKTIAGRVSSSDQPLLLGLSVLIGLTGGLLAVGYYHLVRFLRWLFTDQGSHTFSIFHSAYLNTGYIILVPVAGGLIIGLLNYYFTSDARSSYGVPGVIEAIGLRGGRIRPRVVAARSLAAAVCIGAGGAAGKQGSIVQMGLEIGAMIGQKLHLSEQKIKLLVICGVAALVGANYNTPLGGAILVFEVIMGEFNLNYFSLVVISSATAAVVYRGFVGNVAKFTAPAFVFKSPDELLWYVLLGLLCGVLGVLYVKVVFKSEAVFKELRGHLKGKWQLLIPVLGGLAMGLISYAVPLSFGRGTKGIDLVLTGKLMIPSLMILLLILKLFSVALTMGAWSTGGGYRAGLFTGAMLGGAMGIAIHHLTPGFTSPAATYALVGMAGAFGGFAQAPLTGIVMMSEMTKDFHLIIPLAITSVVAAYTSRALSAETLYTAKLIQRGLDVANARRSDILKNLLVKDAMVCSVDTLPYNMTVRDAFTAMVFKPYEGFPVLGETGALLGMITINDVRRLLREGKAQAPLIDVAARQLVTISPRDTLQDAARKIDRYGVNRLPVVDDDNPGRLLGIVGRNDLIRAYNQDIERVARTVLAGKEEAAPATELLPHITSATEVSMHYYRQDGMLDNFQPRTAAPAAVRTDGEPGRETGMPLAVPDRAAPGQKAAGAEMKAAVARRAPTVTTTGAANGGPEPAALRTPEKKVVRPLPAKTPATGGYAKPAAEPEVQAPAGRLEANTPEAAASIPEKQAAEGGRKGSSARRAGTDPDRKVQSAPSPPADTGTSVMVSRRQTPAALAGVPTAKNKEGRGSAVQNIKPLEKAAGKTAVMAEKDGKQQLPHPAKVKTLPGVPQPTSKPLPDSLAIPADTGRTENSGGHAAAADDAARPAGGALTRTGAFLRRLWNSLPWPSLESSSILAATEIDLRYYLDDCNPAPPPEPATNRRRRRVPAAETRSAGRIYGEEDLSVSTAMAMAAPEIGLIYCPPEALDVSPWGKPRPAALAEEIETGLAPEMAGNRQMDYQVELS
ncbi:chloride channel protein [Desulfotomaculum copahuensis]|uniref:CBS domain-containing protein n=1 Tax=Desulfotomaculum copahuensis TaxID=1838280 RepID=A0A1B7LKE8_9FIRM|nr:chloride channel protein [Desulfotomaculum copahuensis]OAT87046.1 hypothetical protein A6M21_01745 [Desulfotomaculum copahuensis]